MRSAAALSKHLALPCAKCPVSRRHLCPDRPAAGKRHNGSTLGALPSYRGLLAIALLSLALRKKGFLKGSELLNAINSLVPFLEFNNSGPLIHSLFTQGARQIGTSCAQMK